ncbi:MAG: hypothetical protein KGL39_22045 [Patescibacteria group bacterium]|nr:hypothetical protein [Patescibacteria group bacterium]
MGINSLPAVQSILEQANLLERFFYTPLRANLAYSRMADRYLFPNGIGETITKTRPGLFPLSAAITPLTPSNNTNTLDNGLSDTYWKSEQFQLAINEYALTTSVNIKQDRTLIERTFLQNVVALGENAGRTMDGLCSLNVHKAYDAGNTFATAAATGGSYTSVSVDNIYGFDFAFSATNSPGLPSAVSGSNTVTVSVYNGTSGALKGTMVVTAATAGSNSSTAYVNSIAYGASGTLTLQSNPGFNIAAGDQILAPDGAFVVRSGGALTRYQISSNTSNAMVLEDIANAKAQLEARNIPKLPNGMYAAIIDPKLWPSLLNDVAFQRSTMGQMGEAGSYFASGMVNRTLGVEFVNSQMVPRFNTETAGVYARHCVVAGAGALIKGTFQGHIDGSKEAAARDGADIRLMAEDVAMITRDPVDRLQEWLTQTWSWIGGFVVPTDYTSDQTTIPTTDSARYKRCVVIESAVSS